MGRIKEISRRPKHTRKRNPVVYLICEGTETEIRYFKRFRSRECRIDIIPITSQYKAADKLVQKAKSTMGNNPYYPDEGDIIWCVFDRDDNTDEMLRKANLLAEREGYKIAFSNPAFEIWFLYHFDRLLPLQAVAVQRARKRIEVLGLEKNSLVCRSSNPLTTVVDLVEYLNCKK